MTQNPKPFRHLVAQGTDQVGLVAFSSVDGVRAWAEENGGAHAVRELLANQAHRFRAFDTSSRRLAKAWLEIADREAAGREAETQRQLAQRATEAAERSALAGERAAKAAAIAIGISLVALCVAVVQAVVSR